MEHYFPERDIFGDDHFGDRPSRPTRAQGYGVAAGRACRRGRRRLALPGGAGAWQADRAVGPDPRGSRRGRARPSDRPPPANRLDGAVMIKSLSVWWDGACVGALRIDEHGDLAFTYAAGWLADPGRP